MKEQIFKEHCELMRPFSEVLNQKIKDYTVTKNDISTFISVVKDILKEPKK